MFTNDRDETAIQRDYYAQTADKYDQLHLPAQDEDEHAFALAFLVGCIEHLQVQSVLDVGAGTGRALSYLRGRLPKVKAIGVEPVEQLRQVGYAKGIPANALIEGDANGLSFEDGQFDLVCGFGMLHHVRHPSRVVSEMLRVAGKAIFISDANNFGQGSLLARASKQLLAAARLWRAFDWVKTRGKGYRLSDGDGLAYSYSVFDNYQQIKQQCQSVHLLNTRAASPNLYRTASHVALLGIKRVPAVGHAARRP